MREKRHKGYFVVFVLLLFFSTANGIAKIIDQIKAQKIVGKWLKVENRSQHLRVNKKNYFFKKISDLIYQNEAVAFIVELEPSGFMIVPRCSELAPVKFISFSGNYEEIQSHPFLNDMKNKLLYTMGQLGYTRISAGQQPEASDARQKNKNKSIWENLLLRVQDVSVPSVSAAPPLLRSTWSQGTETTAGDAYNMYTPTIDGLHAYTGCSATAQAQVMNFWKHPGCGEGSHSYQWNGQVLAADFEHPYYWSEMLDHYLGDESTKQKDAVARLMSDVGISLNMAYALSGSGAMPNANNSLVKFFLYSPEIKQENRSNYADWTEWFCLLKDQIDKGWPSILGIFKPYSGHAVVIDGYRIQDSINQVHVNMGWGGYADNYYSLDDIYGYGSALRDRAIINIHPEFNSRYYVFSGNDFDGDGRSDMAVWRPSSGSWFIKGQGIYPWGTNGDIPVPADYNAEGKDELAVWRPSNGCWFIKGQGIFPWGTIGDVPVPGDYNGDGKTDIAVWRPGNGCWFVKGQGVYQWGRNGDVPVPGDYNGDGKTDLAVWRPGNGCWFIKGQGVYQWGRNGDIPVPADYNADGKNELAVFRPGLGTWFAYCLGTGFYQAWRWGQAGDIPVSGDYDGNGEADIAVWRPDRGYWYIKGQGIYPWGASNDIPLGKNK